MGDIIMDILLNKDGLSSPAECRHYIPPIPTYTYRYIYIDLAILLHSYLPKTVSRFSSADGGIVAETGGIFEK